MAIKELLKPDTNIILLPSTKIHDMSELARDTKIDIHSFYFKPNWYKIGNDWFYFKEIDDVLLFLNELIGTYLAKHFDLDTIAYSIAKINNAQENNYGLLSKNFRKPDCDYLTINDLKTIKPDLYGDLKTMNFGSESYRDVEQKFLKLIALDFYMSQYDRLNGNLLFERDKFNNINFATLFDYEKSNSYESNNNSNANCYTYINALYILQFPNGKEVNKLLNKYPVFYQAFKSILDIDLSQIIKDIESIFQISISEEIKRKYLQFDKDKKQMVKSKII